MVYISTKNNSLYDPQQAEIENYVIDYFTGITDVFKREEFVYEIGVYGSRNVCLNLDRSSRVSIKNKFVSSYGFSGNLGYVMPKNWAFDQFAVDLLVGSGRGQLGIDKVAVSRLDNGFNKLMDVDIVKDYISIDSIMTIALAVGVVALIVETGGASAPAIIPLFLKFTY